MSDGKRLIRVNPSTLHRELQGEGVLLQLDTGEYFGLDEVGQRIWALIVEHGDLDTVRERLLEEYDVTPEALAADLETLVADLVAKQLIEVAGDPAPAKSS